MYVQLFKRCLKNSLKKISMSVPCADLNGQIHIPISILLLINYKFSDFLLYLLDSMHDLCHKFSGV